MVKPTIRRRRKRYSGLNSFDAKRRHEIIMHARYVGAADSDDFERWLIAWCWHNPDARDQIWSLTEAAKRMGGKITEAEAGALVEKAELTYRRHSADSMAQQIGLTWDQRRALGITTIGATDITKAKRLEIRMIKNRLAKERCRRAKGARPRDEYEMTSLSATRPWEIEGMSRRTWYRKRQQQTQNQDGTSTGTACLLKAEAEPVPTGEAEAPKQVEFVQAFGLKKARGYPSSRTASLMAVPDPVPSYSTLPTELRLMALALPIPGNWAVAA
jgi:hypothetical protein